MNLENYIERLGDHAKDTRLNLGTVLSVDGAPGLTEPQLWGTALACAYSLKHAPLTTAILETAKGAITDAEKAAAKSAAVIMAMNNVYYRTIHLAEDAEISKLPARLRMNVIGNPGIDKKDFELYCLAVSALAGCGSCIKSHVAAARKAGVTNEGIQSSFRIAAVLNAAVAADSIT